MNRLIDIEVLEQLQASIGKEGLPLVLNTFVTQGAELLEQLDSGLNPRELRALCHSLKSSAASVGAMNLSEEAQRLHDEVDLSQPDAVPDTEKLSALLKTSLTALNTYLI